MQRPQMESYGYEEGNASFPTTGLREAQEGQKQKKMFGISVGTRFNVQTGSLRNYVQNVSGGMSYDLVISKTFYFFFFAAFGSLFPLIAVYFKQLGMNPAQTGVLIGLRPFVEFLSAPFWGGLATKYKKGKLILMFSLFCWVTFTLALAFITTPAHYCLTHNGTDVIVVAPFTGRKKRDLETTWVPGYSGNHWQRPLLEEDIERYIRDEPEVPLEGEEIKHKEAEGKESNAGQKEKAPLEQEDTEGTSSAKAKKPTPKEEEPTEQTEKEEEKEPNRVTPTTKLSTTTKTPNKETAGQGADNKGITTTQNPSTPKNKTTLSDKEMQEKLLKVKHMHLLPHPVVEVYGLSPLSLDHKDIANLDHYDIRGLVSPPYSNVVYRSKDIYDVFLLLLLMMIVGEFVSAPSVMLADTATLGYLGDDTESYGKQRMYGSLGWGLAMFFLGIALDYSNVFPNHPCGTEQLVDRNYTVCFAVFSVLMCCAFVTATQMRFMYNGDVEKDTIALGELKGKIMDKFQEGINKIRQPEEDVFQQVGGKPSNQVIVPAKKGEAENARKVQISLQGEDGEETPKDAVGDVSCKSDVINRPSPYIPRGKPGQMGTMPDWLSVIKNFGNLQYGSIIFILWYMGFGVGLVFAFLFWHLQDLTGTPLLFGMASVVAHVAEIVAHIFSKKVIMKIGHIRVIYIGLAANIARFLYISWIRNPWWVLPFELIQGLTHAFIWAACCSYILQSVSPSSHRATAQIIIVGIHHSFGRGCGALLGGVLVLRFGTENTFRGYAIACLFIVLAYAALDYFHIRRLSAMPGAHEPGGIVEEKSALAPHGVPMTVPKDMEEAANDQAGSGYGSTSKPANPYDNQPLKNYGEGDSCFYQGYGDDNVQYGYNMWNTNGILETMEKKKQSDNDIIRKNFKAYQDVTSPQPVKGQAPDRLMMQAAPAMATTTHYQQPENRWEDNSW